MNALFVTFANSLELEGGGVQRCTHEYLATLERAGVHVTTVPFGSDMRPLTRLRRKLFRRPFQNVLEPMLGSRILTQMKTTKADWIFFNHCDGLAVVPEILAAVRSAGVRLGFLSHGLDSTDFVHYVSPDDAPLRGSQGTLKHAHWLGGLIMRERHFLKEMDLTCCLAPTDVEIHRWLGSQHIVFIPRVVTATPIPWNPVPGRIGTISTLGHAPNYLGLVDLCKALETKLPRDLRIRLVGRPEAPGHELAKRFPFIDYLGGLSDADMAQEATTWAGFVNPIFTYPRGCSTKLAVPLSWQIPIYSSRAGARGYFWDEAAVPLADTAAQLAHSMQQVSDLDWAAQLRAKTQQIATASPTWDQVGQLLQTALAQVPTTHALS